MIRGPGPEFPRREPRFETVAVTLRMVREKSIAVTDGTMTKVTDPQTGEIKTREKWEFLPRYHVEIEGINMKDTAALEALRGKVVEVRAEERMLMEKGLI